MNNSPFVNVKMSLMAAPSISAKLIRSTIKKGSKKNTSSQA
jgi:hypothetical protein